MNDLMNELEQEFNSMTLKSEKSKITKFMSHVNEMNVDDNDINIDCLISEFSQLDLSQKAHIVDKFYAFILKCINRDRRHVNSSLFVPHEPPMCR